jgi:hypothetical protein
MILTSYKLAQRMHYILAREVTKNESTIQHDKNKREV